MSLERFLIERALLFRVPGIRKINSVEEAPATVTVYVGDAGGEAPTELLAAAKEVVEKHRPITVLVHIEPYAGGPGDAVPPYELSTELKRACVFVPPAKADLEMLLKTCVPGCVHAEAVTVAGGVVDVYLGDEGGRASWAMVEEAKKLLKEIFPSGVTYKVYDFQSRRRKFAPVSLLQAGTRRLDPALYQDKKLYSLAKEDEERFRDHLGALICGAIDHREIIRHKLPKGAAVYSGPGMLEDDLEVLLTLFPHVYLAVPQDDALGSGSKTGKWRLEPNLLLELARTGRVTPVFRAPLHRYDSRTVLSLLEDPELRVILPRQLDGLTVLTMARQFPFWRQFREDPQSAAQVYQAVHSVAGSASAVPGADEKLAKHFFRVLANTVETHIMVAERGEQWFMDRGHIAAGNLTAGGIIQSLLDLYSLNNHKQKEIRDTVFIEAHVYSMEMVLARALGAVYAPAAVLNEPIFNMVAHLQAGPQGVVFPPGVNELGTILKGLCIMRPRHVPLREYLEVISSSEAERLRQIVTEIINRTGGNPEQLQAELEKFNQEVARWRKSPFHWVQEQVDLLGLGLDLAFLPAGVSIPGLSSIVGLVVKALLGDFLKNSRLLGNLEDRVFGLIGGVSPAAVRISRIRRKIGRKY